MIITSEDNQLYKKAKKLKEKKFRDLYGEYLVEGKRGVSDTDPTLLQTVFVAQSNKDYEVNSDKVVVLSDKLMGELTDTVNSSGVVAIAKKKPESDFASDYVVYLDRIRDPGNMGTIIRTAVAAGYEIVCDNCADVYNPKVVRSCVSALSKAKIHNGNLIDILAEKGYNIIGADVAGERVFDCHKPNKVCIVIGNEANGIRQDILFRCNFLCSIPMNDMESLNAAVSAGILMYYFKY